MKRFIPLLIVLLLTLVLALIFEDFVSQVLIGPLLLLLWVVATYLRNLPHFVFWVAFLIITLIVLLRSLNLNFSLPRRKPKTVKSPSRGYVAGWQDQLVLADRQLYFRWQLAKALGKLSQQILTDPLNMDDAQPTPAMLESMPPEIAAYFRAAPPRKPAAKARWYRRQTERKNPALELDPEVVIAYLEKEMG